MHFQYCTQHFVTQRLKLCLLPFKACESYDRLAQTLEGLGTDTAAPPPPPSTAIISPFLRQYSSFFLAGVVGGQ
jgi:hypothetical protein